MLSVYLIMLLRLQVYRSKLVLVQRCERRGALPADMERTSKELRDRVVRGIAYHVVVMYLFIYSL